MAPKANFGTEYIEYSGTSMATPHIAGVVALLLQADPNLDPAQVKYILTRTTQVDYYSGSPDNTEGYGYVDVATAIESISQLSDNLISLSIDLAISVNSVYRGRRFFGNTLEITVRVYDANGNPVAGVWVLVWVVDSTGVQIDVIATQTGSDGSVTVSVDIGTSTGTFYVNALGDDYYNGYHYAFSSNSVTV